jgi:hypothetical protein
MNESATPGRWLRRVSVVYLAAVIDSAIVTILPHLYYFVPRGWLRTYNNFLCQAERLIVLIPPAVALVGILLFAACFRLKIEPPDLVSYSVLAAIILCVLLFLSPAVINL